MRTILALELSDIARLKSGDTIELTPQLSLSLLSKVKRVRPVHDVAAPLSTDEEVRLAKRRAYSRKWRKKTPESWKRYGKAAAKRTTGTSVHCPKCQRVFGSGQALGGHVNFCKGRVAI